MTKKIIILGVCLTLFGLAFSSVSYAQVVINEFSPFSDTEWVEFYNASESAEYLKSYYIDDDISFGEDNGNKARKSLSEINITDKTYPVIDSLKSFFNNDGDAVVVFDSTGSLIDQYNYETSYGEYQTFGRSPDQTGSFALLESATKGSKNSAIKASPNPTPNPTPSATPNPSPSATPSPVPTSSPSPKPTPKPSPQRSSPSPQPSEEVLGTQELASPITQLSSQQDSQATDTPATFPAGILVIIIGLAISGASGYWAYRLRLKNRTV